MISVCAIAAAALLALGGIARSHLWFHGGNAAFLSALEGQTVTVTGVVTDRRGAGAYLTSYSVRLTSVSGEETSGLVLLTCHYVSDLQPGYAVAMEVTEISL